MSQIRHPFYTASLFKTALRLAAITPFWIGRWIGACVVLIGYPLAKKGRAIAAENLGHVTGLSGANLEALCRRNIFNFGRMLADYFCATRATPKRIRALFAERHGADRIKAALAHGKGVILITGHLGNWELGAIHLASLGHPVSVVSREEPSQELTEWRAAYRERLGIKTIIVGSDKFAFVEIMQALRRNELVALLADRPDEDSGAPVTFFGRETRFSVAPALLWKQTGAVVLPVFVFLDEQKKYVAHAEPPVPMSEEPPGSDTLQHNTQLIASAFETVVREHPEQWYNYSRVWETARPG